MGLFNAILGNASEVTIESASKEFEPILIEGEEIEKAFRLIKDMFVSNMKRSFLQYAKNQIQSVLQGQSR